MISLSQNLNHMAPMRLLKNIELDEFFRVVLLKMLVTKIISISVVVHGCSCISL